MTRTRWLLLAAIIVAIFLPVAYFGSEHFIGRMLETHGVRKLLSGKTAKVLDCDSGYLPLGSNGRTVWSPGFLGKAAPPRALTELRAFSLWARCSLSELWRAKWRIDVLHVSHLQAAYGEAAASHIDRSEFHPPELKPPLQTESPLELDIRLLDVTQLDLYWGTTPERGGEFRKVHAQFFPREHNLAVQGEGGTFHQVKWPEARLLRCKLFFAKPNLRIDEAALDLGGKGSISVLGNFRFEEKQSMDLQMKLSQCPIEPFFGDPSRCKAAGEFDATAHLVKDASQQDSARVTGAIEKTRAVLQKIETLQKLAAFTGRKELANLPVDQLKADYDWNSPVLTVKNLVMESKNIVVFEGEFVMKDEKVDGEFELGVAPDLVDKFPGAREEIFTRSERGYLWTRIALSGPLTKLHDNLKPRLVKAAQDHFAKGLLAPILKPGQSVIEAIQGL